MVRVDTAVCGGLYFHQMTMTEVGDTVPTHEHNYDHVLQVQRGRLKVWTADGGVEEIAAPAVKMIPKGVGHDLEAMEPTTVCCIHLMRDEAGQMFPFAYTPSVREVMSATGRA